MTMSRADRVRRAILRTGWSTRQIAEILGVSQGAVMHWVHGRSAVPAGIEDLLEDLGDNVKRERDFAAGLAKAVLG